MYKYIHREITIKYCPTFSITVHKMLMLFLVELSSSSLSVISGYSQLWCLRLLYNLHISEGQYGLCG